MLQQLLHEDSDRYFSVGLFEVDQDIDEVLALIDSAG